MATDYEEYSAPSKLPKFPAPLVPGGLYAPPTADTIAMRRYMATTGMRPVGPASPDEESAAASYPAPRYNNPAVAPDTITAAAAAQPNPSALDAGRQAVVDYAKNTPPPGKVSLLNSDQSPYPVLDARGGGYGYGPAGNTSAVPQFPTAASMATMVPQEVHDMIAQQANRINFLRAGGGGLLGQAGAKFAQDRLIAMHDLANKYMGTGIQGGQLGVAQGELGVRRGQLDVNVGHLDLANRQLNADIWKNAPNVLAAQQAQAYLAAGRLDEARALVASWSGKSPYDYITDAGPYRTTIIPSREVARRGGMVIEHVPTEQAGGGSDTKKTFGGAEFAPPRGLGLSMPNPYEPRRVTYSAQ